MNVPGTAAEPIAVVGLACRLPGAPDPAAFWRLLREGVDAVAAAPADPRRLPGSAGATGERAALLPAVDEFDAGFFGISPREAAAMDPQQRLLLELAWEALEDARVVPDTLRGAPAGVFVGAIWDDYAALTHRHGAGAAGPHTATGLHRGILANRVSHVLDLRGPSLTVDTGQSSSLVAVELAAQSLRRGECEVALAAGVNLILAPDSTAAMRGLGALSPDGRCYTFDARANGFVRGEGGAVVVLKPLPAARADGDRVYCVIRGGAVNNDGATEGLTVPSRTAQEAMLRRAYRRAGVTPDDVQYVELHGTGTPVGDPVEAAALGAVFGDGAGDEGVAGGRPADEPVHVGSVKTNIGHLEGAAGIAGLLKTVLSIAHRQLPASLHYATPHPRIPLADWRLRVRGELGPWPHPDRPLVAGVSSFGMGGTNCHILLAEPPVAPPPPARPTGEPLVGTPLVPWVLAARDEAALRAQARALGDRLAGTPDTSTVDVGWSLAATRTAFERRAVVVGGDRDTLLRGLDALAGGRPDPAVTDGTARVAGTRTVFVFPGQGSQWAGMARELLDTSATFRAAVEECAEALAAHVDWRLEDVLRGAPGAPTLDRVDVVQPVLFAVMVSLARLWRSLGVHPDAVVGHSQGEIAAACVAGALSLPDAAKVVALRSQALAAVAGEGAMASIASAVDEVERRCARWGDRVSVAAVNGPTSTVVSGDPAAVAELVAAYTAEEIRARLIPVDYASHSPRVEAIRERLLDALAGLTPGPSSIVFVSTVTGEPLDTERLDAGYWYTNLRQPVRFEAAVRTLLDAGHRAFVEISPHPVLTVGVQETVEAAGAGPAAVVGSLRRDEGAWQRLLAALGQLHTAGIRVDWPAFFAGRPVMPVDLPTYAFQRRRYWLDAASGTAAPPASTVDRGQTVDLGQTVDRGETVDRRAALAARPAAERGRELLALVRAHAAAVLGHADPADVPPGQAFKDLGFQSVTAVELRDRLAAATGLALPSTLLYQCPTPDAVARHLRDALLDDPPAQAVATTRPRPSADDDPVVVVGMACRYPGDINTPDDLWHLVATGTDAITEFPTNRGWNPDDIYHPTPNTPGKTYTRHGGFLTNADQFDNEFFNISPREALTMDPQQRHLLELTWQALENAGINPHTLTDTPTGVYIGAMPTDYGPALHQAAPHLTGHLLTGQTSSIISGRIAYTLGLRGPALTIDTACSSSLVATHLAAQALRTGECTLAICGGATIMTTPGMFLEFSRQQGLAPDGRAKAFAANADGTIWSEGAAILILETLSNARKQGHPVYAIIRGSAINNDGASNGLTAPNGPAQQQVIHQALTNAHLTPHHIDYIEAHGTGTTLGDPIELHAINNTYTPHRTHPLHLGTIKSNIGHTQAAAGTAAIIKTIQALHHHQLPPTLHANPPTPHINWTTTPINLLHQPQPWPPNPHKPRHAAISSFGISGTNAHLILQEPPPPPHPPTHTPTHNHHPHLLSAHNPTTLHTHAHHHHTWHTNHPTANPHHTTHTLATRRAHLPHRAVVLATDRDSTLRGLEALATGTPSPDVIVGHATPGGRLAILFTGQGSQRAGMGRELYTAFPAFADALDEVAGHLDAHLARPIRDVMFAADGSPDAALLHQTAYTQAALFALEVALLRLVESWGIHPDLVAGHSIGEVAAAFAAGVLSIEDACALVAARGRLMQQAPAGGAMVSIRATEEEVRAALDGDAGRVDIAAVNAPHAVVVSGDREAALRIAAHWRGQGRKTRELRVSHAFHSPHMEPILAEFRAVAAGLGYRAAAIPLATNVTGELADAARLGSADHWVEHIRRPVRFADDLRALAAAGADTYLELGPDATLTALVGQCLPDLPGERAVSSLRPKRSEVRGVLAAVGRLHTLGHAVDWSALLGGPEVPTVDLPTYPFEHRSFWLRPAAAVTADLDRVGHPLLDAALDAPDGGQQLLGRLSRESHPWLADHAVAGDVLLPGAALVDLALQAAARCGGDHVEELTTHAPLVLPERGAVQVRAVVGDLDGTGRRAFTVHSRPDRAGASWTRHATGVVAAEPPTPPAGRLDGWPPPGAEPLEMSDAYQRLAERGYAYGPAFRCLTAAHRSGDEVFAEVRLPAGVAYGADIDPDAPDGADRFAVHPALLDAVLHAWLLATDGHDPEPGGLLVPFAWRGVALHAVGATALRARLTPAGDSAVRVELADLTGAWVATVESVTLRPLSRDATAGSRPGATHPDLYHLDWVPATLGATLPAGAWAVIGTGPGAARLTETLRVAHPDTVSYPDIPSLAAATAAGTPAPALAVASAPDTPPDASTDTSRVTSADADLAGDDLAGAALAATQQALGLIQAWLAAGDLSATRLALLTSGAVRATEADRTADPVAAAVWGLVRTAQTEHPDRFALVDLDPASDPAPHTPTPPTPPTAPAPAAPAAPQEGSPIPAHALRGELSSEFTPHRAALWGQGAGGDAADAGAELIAAALAGGEPQLAIRAGTAFAARLVRVGPDTALPAPVEDPQWRVDLTAPGSLRHLAVVPDDAATRPLAGGEVRVAVRAAGLNFRDVAAAHGLVSVTNPMGLEGAGVVLQTGSAVTDLAPGDRVMGLFTGAFGPVAVADRRALARVPAGWSFDAAATVPVAFLTAYHGLHELAGIRRGETLLVHSAAGGVGMAAAQLARHWGVTVYGTASPAKWPALRALGLDDAHLASSRTLDFAPRILEATGGQGVDVVLNCLAGEFVDASLRLLPRGGRFVELGKTDPRRPEDVAAAHAGVEYQAFDLLTVDPDRIAAMLSTLVELFDAGALRPLPSHRWDVRAAPQAFRHMSQAKHVGKVVLTVPRPLDPDGTVLVTGGTGVLGGRLARHLVSRLGVRRLLLTSRRGPAAGHTAELMAELSELGAVTVKVAACDAADPAGMASLLATIDAAHPLTAVVHAAGALADGTVEALPASQVAAAFRAKVDGVWNLHRLTRDRDLAAFVMFSSVAGTLGTAGQGAYAAANAFLDALAHHRRALGRPATALAWGMWDGGGMADLDTRDLARMARTGIGALPPDEALALFDAARATGLAVVAPVRLDLATLRAHAGAGRLPSALWSLAGAAVRRAADAGAADGSLRRRLADLSPPERRHTLTDLVRAEAAAVLGHRTPDAVPADRAFNESGFDSLTALELRHRLGDATGLRLPATVIFDQPTPVALAGFLLAELAPGGDTDESTGGALLRDLDRLAEVALAAPAAEVPRAALLNRLEELLVTLRAGGSADDPDGGLTERLKTATDDEIFQLIDHELDMT
ncbi:SDR family NAD(P)-dependent oxidoreductase [Actinomycetes bacterium KLBMP 9797]